MGGVFLKADSHSDGSNSAFRSLSGDSEPVISNDYTAMSGVGY